MFARLTAVAMAAGLVLAVGGTARAGDPYCAVTYVVKKITVCEPVTVYETRCEAYRVCVTRYDECGHPYANYETRYHNVQVPVQKVVTVTKIVKVPAYSY
jgi:hypothetical protein